MQQCEFAADCGRRQTGRCILNWGGNVGKCVYLAPQPDCGHPVFYRALEHDESGQWIRGHRWLKCEEEQIEHATV